MPLLAADNGEQTSKKADNVLEILAPKLRNHGDCTLLHYNGHYGLIDAGGDGEKDRETIYQLLEDNVANGQLDFMVITHSDSDHLNAFESTSEGVGKWLSEKDHKIKKLIDFDVTNDPTVTDKKILAAIDAKTGYKDEEDGVKSMTALTSYRRTRGKLVSKGIVAEYYTASQLFYKERGVELEEILKADNLKGNGKKDLFSSLKLGDDRNAPKIEILKNRFGWDSSLGGNKNPTPSAEGIRNNLSVCLGVTYWNKKALFTGDLEEYQTQGNKRINGETELIKNNQAFFNGEPIELYKAAHHGSRSSSSPEFLDAIRPKNVLIEAKGGGKYKFPDENTVLSLFDWTDKIFITNSVSNKEDDKNDKGIRYLKFEILKDGETRVYDVSSGKGEDSIKEEKLFSDYSAYTEDFFMSKRKSRFCIYNLQTDNWVDDPDQGSNTNCVYVKAGSVDTLIGIGSEKGQGAGSCSRLIKKIMHLCNDGIIDNLILPSQGGESVYFANALADEMEQKKISIGKIFYCAPNKILNEEFNKILVRLKDRMSKGEEPKPIEAASFFYDLVTGQEATEQEGKDDARLGLEILLNPDNNRDAGSGEDKLINSVLTRITFANSSYVHFGVRNDFGVTQSGESNVILEKNPQLLGAVSLVQMPANGMLMNRYAGMDKNGTDPMATAIGKKGGPLSKMALSSTGTGKPELTLLCQGTFGIENNLGYGNDKGKKVVNTLLGTGGKRELYISHRRDNDHDGSSCPANENGNGDLVARVTLGGISKNESSDKEFDIDIRFGKTAESLNGKNEITQFEDNDNYLKKFKKTSKDEDKTEAVKKSAAEKDTGEKDSADQDAFIASKVNLSWPSDKLKDES